MFPTFRNAVRLIERSFSISTHACNLYVHYRQNNKKQKQQILIRYLNQYLLKKDLKMKDVLRNIVYRIEKNQNISIKQYNSIIKFIERERLFKDLNRNQIYRFFEPLIQIKDRKVVTDGSNLSEFLH